jgi:hypothetical protein
MQLPKIETAARKLAMVSAVPDDAARGCALTQAPPRAAPWSPSAGVRAAARAEALAGETAASTASGTQAAPAR